MGSSVLLTSHRRWVFKSNSLDSPGVMCVDRKGRSWVAISVSGLSDLRMIDSQANCAGDASLAGRFDVVRRVPR